MLQFSSGNARTVNSERAIAECLDLAYPDGDYSSVSVLMVEATLGHNLAALAEAARKRVPGAIFLANSCAGVTGREGVGESMHEVGLMGISGPREELAVASVQDLNQENSLELGRLLGERLAAQCQGIQTVFLLLPGMDVSADQVFLGLESVLGQDVLIFGGMASDNMRGRVSFQAVNERVAEHDAWAIGFADPGLKAVSRATHGFTAYGAPLTVTRTDGKRIYEFDGRNAWEEYTSRLSLPPSALVEQTVPVGALAEELPPELAAEYGNSHIMRGVATRYEDGSMAYPVRVAEGTRLWLTHRDEDLIFSEQQRSLDYLSSVLDGRVPVAVFQMDCLARGRLLFGRVMKDELMGMIQKALSLDGQIPPWLGMYGFGEFALLGGRNIFHNYSTALLVLYR